MKKTLFVIAVVAMLVFAFASSAFAASGQQRQGAAAAAPAVVQWGPFAGTSVAGAGTNTYMDWNPSLGTNALDNSPHGNYTTTTVKCVVCHAVHYAAPGMAPVGGGQAADTLLRMKAADACVFCHATAGMAVNGVPVYEDGLGNGHVIGSNCDECHTGVHAAGADNSVASLRGFLLKTFALTDPLGQGATANMYDAADNIDDAAVAQGFAAGAALGYTADDLAAINTTDARTHAVGVFCAECHFGAYATSAAGAATNVNGSSTSLMYSGHRVGADVVASTSWNSDGSISSGRTDIGQVAWAPATTCNSCHDAKYSSGNTAFPHGWGGAAPNFAKMWLTSADDAATGHTDVNAANGFDAGVPQLSDGVCLKCHVGDVSNGVGITF